MSLIPAIKYGVAGCWAYLQLVDYCHRLNVPVPHLFILGDAGWPSWLMRERTSAYANPSMRRIVLVGPRLRMKRDEIPGYHQDQFISAIIIHELAHIETDPEARPHGVGFAATCKRFAEALSEVTSDHDLLPSDGGHTRYWPVGRYQTWNWYCDWQPDLTALPTDYAPQPKHQVRESANHPPSHHDVKPSRPIQVRSVTLLAWSVMSAAAVLTCAAEEFL